MSYQDALSQASTAAMADIQSAPTPAPEAAPVAAPAPEAAPAPPEAAPPASAAPEVPPADTSQPAAAPVAETTPAEPVDAGGGQKWTFTRKGQQVEVNDPTQALELIRKGYDYTEKTMELATQRRAFEEQRQATLAWLQDPANLRLALAHLEGQAPAQTQAPVAQTQAPAADDLATHQDLQRYQQQLAAQLQATQQQTAQMIQAAQLRAETDRYTQEYKAEVNKTLSTLYDSYPLLKEVEKVEKLILDDVSEQIRLQVQENPDQVVDIAEVKVLLAQNAKRRHDRLDAKLKDFRKMEVVRQAKLTSQGAEPPGGAPPAPPPPKAYKLGDPALTADVIKELQQAFDSKR
jgi:hypothetical protein